MRKAPEIRASGGERIAAVLQARDKRAGVRAENTVEKPGLRRGGKRERVHDGLQKWITTSVDHQKLCTANLRLKSRKPCNHRPFTTMHERYCA
jgi:hypothetical protein